MKHLQTTGGRMGMLSGASVRYDPIGNDGPTRLALQLDYSYAPSVGDGVLFEEAGATPRTFYQPAVENHYVEFTLQLGHGFSFSDEVHAFVNGSVGARLNSSNQYEHGLVALFQFGLTAWDWFAVELYVPIFEPGTELTQTNISGVGATRYLGLGLRLSAWLDGWIAPFIGVEGAFYASSNAAVPTFHIGVESRFQGWGE